MRCRRCGSQRPSQGLGGFVRVIGNLLRCCVGHSSRPLVPTFPIQTGPLIQCRYGHFAAGHCPAQDRFGIMALTFWTRHITLQFRRRGTMKAPSYDCVRGDFGFEGRRECRSNALIMSHARPALTINSNTARFASIGAPDSHQFVRQRLPLNTRRTRLGNPLAEGSFSATQAME